MAPPGTVSVGLAGTNDPRRDVEVVAGQAVEGPDFQFPPRSSLFRGSLAERGDLSMEVTPLPGSAVLSAYEPVVVRVAITNQSQREVYYQEASDFTTRIQVRDPRGWLAAVTPRRDMPYDMLSTVQNLKPGETHTEDLIVSSLCPFRDPGDYTIVVQKLGLFDLSSLRAEGRAVVKSSLSTPSGCRRAARS